MKFNVEKLKQMSRPMTEEEKKDIEFRRKNCEWLAISERLALKLRRILRAEGISQNELAARMEVTPAQVTKILSGKENLGLKTISKIEKAIGQSLIEVTVESSQPTAVFSNNTTAHTFAITKHVASTPVASVTRRRSGAYSSIVVHNMLS